jgi:hypothetical protein
VILFTNEWNRGKKKERIDRGGHKYQTFMSSFLENK